jgi:cysteine synthase B
LHFQEDITATRMDIQSRTIVPGWSGARGARPIDLLDAVGQTALLALSRISRDARGATILAKAEHLNPGGSVKDRPARAMLLDGLSRGVLAPGRTILEATSGNTGIADALFGRALGFPVRLCVPGKASTERLAILRALGAELFLTDPLEGSDGAIRLARRLAAAEPETYFYPDQYSNPENWRAHWRTTGPEIFEQAGGRLTHFVAGVGTSGTFTGVTRYLKARSRSVTCVSMQPDSEFHGLEGMKHMDSAITPEIYDPKLADAEVEIRTEEAYAMCRRLVREEGLFVGPSSGANVAAALRVARDAGPGAVVATILCDGGGRYLSERFWEEA